jgi:hypothetical protein
VVVGGADEAEAQSRRERGARGVGGLAPAHRVAEVRKRPAVVFRVAVLGVDLDHRRAGLGEAVPVHAAPPLRVGEVVRDHERALLDAEAPQPLGIGGVVEGPVIAREHHALVAPLRRMPLEAEKGAELAVAVAPGDHLLHARPGVLQALEAVDPVPLAPALHRRHVVPARMPGEGEEIQVRARHLERALDRADAVAVRVVVVNVAVEDAIAAHPSQRSRLACTKSSSFSSG